MVRPAMRLVSLCLVEDPNSTLTFHPRLTVVFGLTPEARSFLAESLSLMVNGQSAGVFAQVDVDGTLIDVGPGYRRVPAPIQVVDSIIHAQDLLEPRMGAMGRKAGRRHKRAQSTCPINWSRPSGNTRPRSLRCMRCPNRSSAFMRMRLLRSRRGRRSKPRSSGHAPSPILDASQRCAEPSMPHAKSSSRRVPISAVVRADTIDTVKGRIELLEAHLASANESLASLPFLSTTGVIERARRRVASGASRAGCVATSDRSGRPVGQAPRTTGGDRGALRNVRRQRRARSAIGSMPRVKSWWWPRRARNRARSPTTTSANWRARTRRCSRRSARPPDDSVGTGRNGNWRSRSRTSKRFSIDSAFRRGRRS